MGWATTLLISWNYRRRFIDQHADPKYFYWDDDCLEIFIDEDAFGGDHEFNYNAFAYNVALDNQIVDIDEKHADGFDNSVLLNDL